MIDDGAFANRFPSLLLEINGAPQIKCYEPAGRTGAVLEAVLFDLDDTLVVDDQAVVMALMATCAVAEVAQPAIDAMRLFQAVWTEAHQRYAPSAEIGITPIEALMVSSHPELPSSSALREKREETQISIWETALAGLGADRGLAGVLRPRLRVEREARLKLLPGARETLGALRGRYRLGLVTNGSSEMQRFKLASLDLAGFFEVILVSEEAATRKPERAMFEQALSGLGTTPAHAVMVGDDWHADVEGAYRADVHPIWVPSKANAETPAGLPCTRIGALSELGAALAEIVRR